MNKKFSPFLIYYKHLKSVLCGNAYVVGAFGKGNNVDYTTLIRPAGALSPFIMGESK
jgi:hypothetical protein